MVLSQEHLRERLGAHAWRSWDVVFFSNWAYNSAYHALDWPYSSFGKPLHLPTRVAVILYARCFQEVVLINSPLVNAPLDLNKSFMDAAPLLFFLQGRRGIVHNRYAAYVDDP